MADGTESTTGIDFPLTSDSSSTFKEASELTDPRGEQGEPIQMFSQIWKVKERESLTKEITWNKQ
jgi:hypothetical protein